MKIIDFHTHPYMSEEQNLNMYREIYSLSVEEQKKQLLKAGISQICGSVIMPMKEEAEFETIRLCNRAAWNIQEVMGDFYIPGVHIHPSFVRESCEEIEWAYQNKIRLIGELVPYSHGWSNYDEQGLLEILDCAKQYRMVVSYHSTNTDQVDKMLMENPEISFVAAHPGERIRVEQHVERMKKYPNLYLDLSGTGLFRYGLLKYLVKQVGSQRIVFGTDYPICNPEMYVHAVYGEDISCRDRENIFFRNAERLLQLK